MSVGVIIGIATIIVNVWNSAANGSWLPHAGVIMGYNLTNIDDFHCQYEDLRRATLQQMLHYVTS